MKNIIMKLQQVDQSFKFKWNTNWIPLMVSIFGWRATKDRLPTRKALVIRGIPIDTTFFLVCGSYQEDIEHLLKASEPLIRFGA